MIGRDVKNKNYDKINLIEKTMNIQHYLSWQLVSAADLERELSSWSRLMVSAK